MNRKGRNVFGEQAILYSIARRGFPEAVFDCFEDVAYDHVQVFDLGCGTGISSRQIANRGFGVVGVDADERMIRQARADSVKHNILYEVSLVERLPFAQHSVGVFTAFSSFHWFCEEGELIEIKKVLKEDGIFFVVNKNDVGGMRDVIVATLKKFIEKGVSSAKFAYRPRDIMASAGFRNVESCVVESEEWYSLEDMLLYAQTTSLWDCVPEDRRRDALIALDGSFVAHGYKDAVPRFLDIEIVFGFNN